MRREKGQGLVGEGKGLARGVAEPPRQTRYSIFFLFFFFFKKKNLTWHPKNRYHATWHLETTGTTPCVR
jgi:hypothetical protein